MDHAGPTLALDSVAFAETWRTVGYVVCERIGSTEALEIYRAYQAGFHREVTLLKLAADLTIDVGFKRRFIEESLAAQAITHEGIVPIYDVGEVCGTAYVALPYPHKEDLGSLVRRMRRDGKQLSIGRVAAIVGQLAAALDATHGHSLVHGNVKPANMLLTARDPGAGADHVSLCGFGLSARLLASAGPSDIIVFTGAIGYASPEQIAGREPDSRADQYSLACSVFEMLTGRPPFSGVVGHIVGVPPPITSLRPDLSTEIDDVFAKVLSVAPGDRYQNCVEFVGHLVGALNSPPPALQQRTVTSVPRAYRGRGRGRRALADSPASLTHAR